MSRPLHIKNARIWDDGSSVQRDLYTAQGRVVESPAHDALVVDLEGYTIFPGLVNAHDHLELNHYPRTKFRDVYNNAHEWGEDVNARLNDEPFKTLRAYPLWDKVFIGGLKNLLCGATTVVHHGPPHKPMFRQDFPVRVLEKYGWSHSLHFASDDEIVRSYRSTPNDVPWFIHLAEGTDDIATGEYSRLMQLGCVGKNTVIVHGVGMDDNGDIDRAGVETAGVIWCPSTNRYLLGRTIDVYTALTVWFTDVGLGSDSRLTADGDLLDELRAAVQEVPATWALITATHYSRMILKNYREVCLRIGGLADFLVIPDVEIEAADFFCQAHRSDLPLVVLNGIPRIGSPELMAKFPHIQSVGVILDGIEKRIHIDLARQVQRCQLKEPGLEIDALPKNRFWLF